MNNGIFGRLSTEESQVAAGAAEYTVEDAISAEEAYVDALNIASTIEADTASMNQADVAIDRLEAQVSTEEAILAHPEQVTASTVVLAQESLATTAMLLGADASMLAAHTISNEAVLDNPVSALQVSNEGVSDFIKKLYESIKLIFKKIMNAGKKLFVKLVVAINGTAKAAKALQDKWKKTVAKTPNPGKATWDDKEGEKYVKQFAACMLMNSQNTLNIDSLKSVLSLTANRKDRVEHVLDVLDTIRTAVNTVEKTGTEENIEKAAEDVYNAIDENSELEKILTDSFNYTKPDGKVNVTGVVFKGSTLKVAEIVIPKEDTMADSLPKLKIAIKSLTADITDINTDKVAILGSTDITGLLTEVVNTAKGLDKYKGNVEKDIKTLDKNLDKDAKVTDGNFATNAAKSFANRMTGNLMNGSRAIATGVLLDSVLAYASNTKAVLNYVKANIAEYKDSSI